MANRSICEALPGPPVYSRRQGLPFRSPRPLWPGAYLLPKVLVYVNHQQENVSKVEAVR
jgi:hypothetical protein